MTVSEAWSQESRESYREHLQTKAGFANPAAKHLEMLQQVLTGFFRLLRHLIVPKAMPRTDRRFPCNKVRQTNTQATPPALEVCESVGPFLNSCDLVTHVKSLQCFEGQLSHPVARLARCLWLPPSRLDYNRFSSANAPLFLGHLLGRGLGFLWGIPNGWMVYFMKNP